MAAPQDDSTALVQRIANQEHAAFSAFYDRYSPMVYSLVLRMLRSSSDADDVLQDVFMQVWRTAASYSPSRGAPEAWLINIGHSRAIDRLRSKRRMEERLILTADPESMASRDNLEDSAAETESRLTVNSVLSELPEPQRRVLELAYFDGLSQSEIAAKLRAPLGTVKTWMRAGLKRLKEMAAKTWQRES